MTFPAQLISFITSQQYQIKYDTPGDYQFTVPEGVSSLSAVVIGGGGGGAGSDGTTLNFGTGGGGGGGTTWSVFGVQPGDILNVSVGTGGTGGSQSISYNGITGGTSSISIISRPEVGAINQTILRGFGGSGGSRNSTGTGGNGGTGNSVNNIQTFCPIYRNGGGNGGSGGTGTTGASGGGGTGGYTGNGGTGGSGGTVGTNNPTAAATDSGGGGGGGGSTTGLGYGGGGLGSFGFVGTGQGIVGINNSSGGGGASYFIDPNSGIIADFVGQSISITNTINYPLDSFGQPLQGGDFLLLLSGSDSSSGITSIPVPVGFTTISQSANSVYTISSSGIATEIVPSNIILPSRDLNFTSSYRYIPSGGLSGSISGLTGSSIHNMIALRNLPSPASISWVNTSGDPATNSVPSVTLMPDPPLVSLIPQGALSIAVGFLANTPLNPSNNTAGANTISINSISGGIGGEQGRGIGLVASYIQTSDTSTGTYNPDTFLTGTTSHARAYSIQVDRLVAGTPVTVVGSAVTSTLANGTPVTTLNLPTGVQTNDILIYICANDSPLFTTVPLVYGANSPSLAGVTWTTPNGNAVNVPGTSSSGFDFQGTSTDGRGGGGLGFKISYVTYSGSATQITGLSGGSSSAPTSHMVIVLRNAKITTNPPNYKSWDNGADSVYGPPDPPALTTNSVGAFLLAIGMIDNIAISNVTTIDAPTGYTMLAQQSYGVQNNGAIIMSAYKSNLAAAASEDPSNFIGGGGNIWASQTLIIGGPETTGTNTRAGLYGGGGASMADDTVGSGMDGGQGSVRLIWGTGRRYPSSNQLNLTQIDWIP